jgi:FtsP/CotA-like multicopper oxidase with cupredoxin domain
MVGRDGIPVGPDNGGVSYQPVSLNHILLAPAGRADIVITGPAAGHTAVLSTLTVDTGCAGDTDGGRSLVAIHGISGSTSPMIASQRTVRTVGAFETRRNTRFAALSSAAPVRSRKLVFTEYPLADGSRTDFYVTELSNPTAYEHPFKMTDGPSIVAKVGTTEDWVIENWTQEIHAFHIHQIHFKVLTGLPSVADGLGMLMDTVNVPFGGYVVRNGQRVFVPGAVRLRMDFRDPQIVGDFVYHCHVLEHEDNGMMAKVRVLP